MTDRNTYAFPFNIPEQSCFEFGMNLRDYFAAAALPSVIGQISAGPFRAPALEIPLIAAKAAYDIADAMMERRDASQ